MPSELKSSTPDLQRASWARKTQGLEKTHERDAERCVLLAHPLTSLVALTPPHPPDTSVSLLSDEVTFQALQLRVLETAEFSSSRHRQEETSFNKLGKMLPRN